MRLCASKVLRLRRLRIIAFLLLLLCAVFVLGRLSFVFGVELLYGIHLLTEVQHAQRFENQFDDLCQNVLGAFHTQPVIDSTGDYRIVRWPNTPDTDGDISLVSQCSFDKLGYLPAVKAAWPGPLSLAVFVASDDHLISAVEMLMKFSLCSPFALHGVSVLLVLPLSPNSLFNVLKPSLFSCSHFQSTLSHDQNDVNYNQTVVYPNNLLRNIALDATVTDYVFVIDIDMIPNPTLFTDFSKFVYRENLEKSTNLVAFVVPVFEVKHNISAPRDRASLLQLKSQGDVQPFYFNVCWKCQRQTDYSTWYNLTEVQSLSIGFFATWHDPWEPFYILPRLAPRYDERFKQYGFNRISQSCELYIAGYNFAILNNAFLIHRGFKTSGSFHIHKEAEQAKNRLLFRRFKEELKERYLNSKRRC